MNTPAPTSESGREVAPRPGFLRSKPLVFIVGILLVIGVWVLDYQFQGFRFYPLYLLPISLVAWHCGRLCAMLLSLLAVGLWVVGDPDEVSGLWSGERAAVLWNVLARLATFLAASLVIARLRTAFDRERELARTDQVTGGPNRHRFMEAARAELDRARRYGRPFTVAYLDVDDFKLLNDRQGHDAGDAALRRTSEVIAANLRGSDSFARIGGDEFAILLPETGLEPAREVADRIRQKLLDAAGQAGWPITFTLGVAAFRSAPKSVEEMLRQADELMYEAKKGGKNRIEGRVFESEDQRSGPSTNTASRTV